MDKNIEQMEYSLGKDHLPNLHWKEEIPSAWSIVSRPGISLCNSSMANSVVTLKEGIPYKFNNLGYRSNFDYEVDKLKTKDIILILGDSDASGRGVKYHDMYSSKIAQQLQNYCVVNLGVASASPDSATRIGVQTMLALKSSIKHVCMLWPIFSSREFVSKKFSAGIHPSSKVLPYEDWWNQIDWVNNNYNYQKNRLLLEQTALANNIEFHDLIVNRYDKKSPITYNTVHSPDNTLSKETDFTEFTPEAHTAIANYYIKKITGKPTLREC